MSDFLTHAWWQLLDRTAGPFHFRFIVQPAVAMFLAIRSGLRDAREHQPAFLWTLASDRSHRRKLLRSAWIDIGRVCIISLVMDSIYQFVLLRWFYPVQALIVTFFLAVVPYVALRGPVTRLATRRTDTKGRTIHVFR